ncbi:MAG TPA: invasion associated locus B family protein [Thermohalobaculum sp.]|nr:invasion associated locus B family protein [Thermohalobaculum sp.]
MTRATRTLGAALAAVMLGTGSAPAQEQTAGEVVATHGAWSVRCAGGEELCIMSQVGKDASGKEVIELQLRKLEGANAPDGTPVPAAIQIVTPLGVLLPAGVRIKIDAQQERAAPFQVCTPDGCVVRQPLSPGFLEELKAGANATITMVAVPQQEVPATISLTGFTNAFDAL